MNNIFLAGKEWGIQHLDT